jgi:adenylate cyclase
MNNRRVRVAIAVWLGVTAFFSVLLWQGAFRLWQEKLTDLLFTSEVPPPELVLIGIDDESIRSIGQWPWPRRIFGEILPMLNEAQVIGIDVNFKETSRLGAVDDQFLAEALSRASAPVILSAELVSSGVSGPAPVFQSRAKAGFTNLLTGRDGVVREFQLRVSEQESFSSQVARAFHSESGENFLKISPNDKFRINFWGRQNTFPILFFRDVLAGRLPVEFFKDKIVLIGATALDLQDYHVTPVGVMSGVELQANVVETIIQEIRYRESGGVTLLALLVLTGLAVLITSRLERPISLIGVSLGILFLYVFGALILFDQHFILDIFYPSLGFIVAGAMMVVYHYAVNAKEKRFIRDSFAYYVSPEVVAALIQDPTKLKLGGEKRNLTILFSDIRGFTSVSEKLPPERLTVFLNRYLTRMSNLILHERGLIDKYIGDAIMALWGTPLENKNHSEDAVRAALKMMEGLEVFNQESIKMDEPNIDIGIGINTGDVTAGNMGSEKRFDYTVIGDAVNLAARLEGLNKLYGTNIIISGFTLKALSRSGKIPDDIVVREIDKVRVKGKTEPVIIFEVVPKYRRQQFEKISSDFETGRTHYYAGNWAAARADFEKILRVAPEDGPTKLLMVRTEELKNQNLPWDGVYTLTTK